MKRFGFGVRCRRMANGQVKDKKESFPHHTKFGEEREWRDMRGEAWGLGSNRMGYSVTFFSNVRDQGPLSGVRCIDGLGGILITSNCVRFRPEADLRVPHR